ncbi:MAG TPA: hypothetical protein VHX62_19305, partial [Solirubrobacteraceae bacterium]|nr:hypothetical protein [Solirubrobacteraceae bacterium]
MCPAPSPSSSRPPDSASTVAADRASSAGFQNPWFQHIGAQPQAVADRRRRAQDRERVGGAEVVGRGDDIAAGGVDPADELREGRG